MSIKKIRVGEINCGADELFLISGPCVIEEEMIMMKTAEKLKEVSERMKIKVIYKSSFTKDNRSSLKYYQGPGLKEGVKMLAKVKERFGFPLLTDIHYPDAGRAGGRSMRCFTNTCLSMYAVRVAGCGCPNRGCHQY